MRNEAETVRQIATEAAELAARLQGTVAVRDKGGGEGPVTDADLAVEELIVAGLRAAFPDDPILAEETVQDVELGAPRLWCVDPIDGTREYSEGSDQYAIQIGLLIDGAPTAGVLALPGTGQVFWGGEGDGAFVDEGGATRPIVLPRCEDLAHATLVHSRTHKSRALREALARLDVGATIEAGSVGYKVAQILLGRAHVYLHPGRGTKWWDSAGPGAVLRAAGGDVRNSRGEPLRYAETWAHRNGLLFTGPGLADVVARALADET
jgi:3'(2'), 5'-bisphosphate nucleotidase